MDKLLSVDSVFRLYYAIIMYCYGHQIRCTAAEKLAFDRVKQFPPDNPTCVRAIKVGNERVRLDCNCYASRSNNCWVRFTSVRDDEQIDVMQDSEAEELAKPIIDKIMANGRRSNQSSSRAKGNPLGV